VQQQQQQQQQHRRPPGSLPNQPKITLGCPGGRARGGPAAVRVGAAAGAHYAAHHLLHARGR